MHGDLFEWTDEDNEEHDMEDGIYREQRAKTGEEESALEMKAKIEPEDQARYNKFMDTFYRRVNADARSSFDPLETAVMSRKAKKAKKEGKKKAGGNKKTPKKKPKSKKKSKKNSRQAKDLSLEVNEDDNTEAEDEALERQERSAVPVEENSDVATARKGKPKGGKKGKKEKSGKNKGGKKKGGKKKKTGNKKSNKKTKRSANKKDSKKGGKSTKGSKKATRSGPQTSKASVSGVSTLTRVGDVSVVDKKDGKELRSDFKLGPVNLKVNRKFGTGKKAIVRTATATTPELTGKMSLYVS